MNTADIRLDNWPYGSRDFDPDFRENNYEINPDEYEEYKYNYLKDEIYED